jgi:hypothetical protein
MADFAPLKSAEFTNFSATPPLLVGSYRWGSKMRGSSASLTFTAAGTGTAKMIRLPAGKVRVITDLCRIVCPVGTATSDLHVGYAAHVSGSTGAAVVADDNAFADNVDVGGGAIDAAFTLPAVGYFDFDSADGVDLEVMFDTANSPAAGEMWLYVAFQQGN